MKIAVNTTSVITTFAGVGVHASCLLKELADIDKKNSYVIFACNKFSQRFELKAENFKTVKIGAWGSSQFLRIFWEQFILPFELWFRSVDTLLSLTNVTSIFSPVKKITIIADLEMWHMPLRFTLLKRIYLTLLTRPSLKRSISVGAVSENTRKDIIKYFEIDPHKVKTILHGPGNNLPSPDRIEPVLEKFKLTGSPYIFFVGTLEPGKNLDRLLKAFGIVVKKRPDLLLAVAGNLGWKTGNLQKKMQALQIIGNVRFLGYVNNSELAVLYNQALFFVFPSLYEGFGLPILEAMNFGAAVIASNSSSIPEISGDAVSYFDPYDVEDMAQKMISLAGNEPLRKELAARGYKHCKQFSWRKTAVETLALIEST